MRRETERLAESWTELMTGYSSPGLTDEATTFFLAEHLEKAGPGGGDESESIHVHDVPFDDVPAWLSRQAERGVRADLKLFAGLHLAKSHLQRRERT